MVSVPNVAEGPEATAQPIVYTEQPRTGAPATVESTIMVLLPGECASITSSARIVCNREDFGTSPSDPPPAVSKARLMETHPIKVVAVAEVNGVLPWLGRRTIEAQTFSYRQPIPRSPFSEAIDPLLSAGGTEADPVGPPPSLPAPAMATPTPFSSCVVDWGKCLQKAAQFGRSYCPIDRNEQDGKCACDQNACFTH